MNKIQKTLREMTKDLHDVGAIDKTELRQQDTLFKRIKQSNPRSNKVIYIPRH